MKYQFEDTTRKIIGAFYETYNALGPGFLEKVYENALLIEMRAQGLRVNSQYPISVYYKTHCVGEYVADIIVEDKVYAKSKLFKSFAPNMKHNY